MSEAVLTRREPCPRARLPNGVRFASIRRVSALALVLACSGQAVDYEGKSCARGPCPGDLICVPTELICKSPSSLAGGARGAADPAVAGDAGEVNIAAGTGSNGAGTGSDSGITSGGRAGHETSGHGGAASGLGGVAAAGRGAVASGGDEGAAPGSAGAEAGENGAAGVSGAGGDGEPDGWGGTTERMFYVTAPWETHYLKICYRLLVAPADQANVLDFWAHARTLLEGSWARAIDKSLQEWSECGNPFTPQLAVSLFSTGPSSSELGDPGGGAAREVRLNVHATDVEILYTFGRALGFGHEYARHAFAGTCVSCTDSEQCARAGRTTCLPSGHCGNPADHESIMAAPDCGGLETLRKFSAWDVLGAQRAYGHKPFATFVDHTGRCLDVYGGLGVTDANMSVYTCDEPTGEYFYRTSDDSGSFQGLSASFGSGDVCVAHAGPLTDSSPTPLETADCRTGAPEQRVEFPSLRLRAMGNQCVAARSAAAGAELAVYDCDDEQVTPELARWSVGAHHIELAGSGLCITAPVSSPDGTHLTLEACEAALADRPIELQSGLILFESGDTTTGGAFGCVRIADPLPTYGSPLLLATNCDPSRRDESFYVTGPVVSANRCMARMLPSLDDGTLIGLVPCDGGPPQDWDYHF
jgi:hypothetical protein